MGASVIGRGELVEALSEQQSPIASTVAAALESGSSDEVRLNSVSPGWADAIELKYTLARERE